MRVAVTVISSNCELARCSAATLSKDERNNTDATALPTIDIFFLDANTFLLPDQLSQPIHILQQRRHATQRYRVVQRRTWLTKTYSPGDL
jgi:hypothetical protein